MNPHGQGLYKLQITKTGGLQTPSVVGGKTTRRTCLCGREGRIAQNRGSRTMTRPGWAGVAPNAAPAGPFGGRVSGRVEERLDNVPLAPRSSLGAPSFRAVLPRPPLGGGTAKHPTPGSRSTFSTHFRLCPRSGVSGDFFMSEVKKQDGCGRPACGLFGSTAPSTT